MMLQLQHPAGVLGLTTLVRDCSVSGVARRVLLLRMDLLPPKLARPHHLRLAYEALEPLAGADRARRHELGHGRMALSWRGDAPDLLRQVLESLENLLLDAPLEAPAMPEFVRLFELPRDGAALLAVAAGPSLAEQREIAARPPPKPAVLRPPLEPKMLEAMEAMLATASVARYTRRRVVCKTALDTFTPAWETRVLSINELMDDLSPGCNAYADPWLFRRLTRMLDRRMLTLLSAPAELRGAGPFSLNLNVGGILSPEFLRFDAALPGNLRGHAVLDLDPADVMADLPAYRFARAFAQTRGYRILLRAMSPTLLPVLDLPSLDLDFIELRWEPALAGLDPQSLKAGTARWVLSRVDDAAAVRWGTGAGIGLFQGDVIHPGGRVPEAKKAA